MKWSRAQITKWIEEEASGRPWYQRFELKNGIVTPGSVESEKRLQLLNLGDLTGKSVLDVGCNSGMYCFECKRRNATTVVGIDIDEQRLHQARTINEILGMDVTFLKKSLDEVSGLGRFDIILCIAVLTEVENLVGGLLELKSVAQQRILLELDIAPSFGRWYIFASSLLRHRTKRTLDCGTAKLRKIKAHPLRNHDYALSPDWHMLESLFADEFTLTDLGPSVRYSLIRLDRKP